MTVDELVEPTQVLVRFRVIGTPMPAGSKVPFTNRATGRAGMKESNEITHVGWRNAVAEASLAAAREIGHPLDGALALEVTFRFPMPASRKAAVRAMGLAPKTTVPDTSKLVRSIEDSMQAAGLIVNDARFATVFATKVEVLDQWVGCEITIRRQT